VNGKIGARECADGDFGVPMEMKIELEKETGN
jgi:hypothetical protein